MRGGLAEYTRFYLKAVLLLRDKKRAGAYRSRELIRVCGGFLSEIRVFTRRRPRYFGENPVEGSFAGKSAFKSNVEHFYVFSVLLQKHIFCVFDAERVKQCAERKSAESI